MIKNNCFKFNNEIWYKHPKFKKYACSRRGEVLYKYEIVKPILINNELCIIITLFRFKIYLLKRLVYESYNDIEECPFIMNKDGDIMNNSIDNLELLHLKEYKCIENKIYY